MIGTGSGQTKITDTDTNPVLGGIAVTGTTGSGISVIHHRWDDLHGLRHGFDEFGFVAACQRLAALYAKQRERRNGHDHLLRVGHHHRRKHRTKRFVGRRRHGRLHRL